MKGNCRIIDSDLHVQEPTIGGDFLNEYLDKPYRNRVNVYNSSPPGQVNWTVIEIDGKIYRRGRQGNPVGVVRHGRHAAAWEQHRRRPLGERDPWPSSLLL